MQRDIFIQTHFFSGFRPRSLDRPLDLHLLQRHPRHPTRHFLPQRLQPIVGHKIIQISNSFLIIFSFPSVLCGDLVYVVLFPQFLLVLYFSRANTYGSVTSYFFGLVLRLLCECCSIKLSQK